MPQQFYNPYFFLPVAKGRSDEETIPFETIKQGEHDNIRHDLFYPGYHTGIIRCTITTKTPTLVGNLHLKKDENEPALVIPYQRNGQPAIPSNSLRGMIGVLIEALSNSSMRVLQNREYSVRKQTRQALAKVGRVVKVGDDYQLQPLGIPQNLSGCKIDREIDFKNFSLACKDHIVSQGKEPDGKLWLKRGRVNKEGWTSGYLRITNGDGQSQKKKKFIPIPTPVPSSIPIDPEAETRLYRLCAQVEQVLLPEGYESYKLQEGHLLYFATEGNGENTKVSELSYSAIWREDFVVRTSFEAFKQLENGHNLLPWGWKEPGAKDPRRSRLTPAECLLGVVEEMEEDPNKEEKNPGRNLASRLRFTDGLPSEDTTVELVDGGEKLLKILASPKPPSEKMYFHKSGDGNNSLHPNGRKVYLHHRKEHLAWETKDEEENKNQKLKCQPIAKEQRFSFRIHFHNLSDAELALLLTALKPDDTFQHRLGLGKPLGLGSVKLAIDKLEMKELHKTYSQWDSTPEPKDWKEYWCEDSGLVDPDVLSTLQWLGNPSNVECLVHYPLIKLQWNGLHTGNKAEAERKLYRWFVNNNKAKDGGQSLKEPDSEEDKDKPRKLEPN